jgi:alpha-beta hydrolase superfamily lysophospholipase
VVSSLGILSKRGWRNLGGHEFTRNPPEVDVSFTTGWGSASAPVAIRFGMANVHEEGPLTQRAVPGPSLYTVRVRPEGSPKATIGIVPGYADHAGRYAHVQEAWADAGLASVAIDLRGHGRAAGARGFCNAFGEFLDDAGELARIVRADASGGPCFLLGHSFGGLVAAMSAIQNPSPWRGLVLSAPFFGLALDVPGVKLLAARVASRLMPGFGIPSGIAVKDLTHDAARAEGYERDPLVFKKATARWFTEAKRAQAETLARAGELRLPLYETFGECDPVAKNAAGRAFFDGAASTDKTWNERKGALHEVLNEPDWRELTTSIAEWVTARAGGEAG